MYRLPSERIAIELPDGPTVEVERLAAWPILRAAAGLVTVYFAASTPVAEDEALRAVYGFFVTEAQPTWEIADHRGPIPPTAAGMLRLPLEMGLGLVQAWTETITPKASAVDAVIPAGPLRDELKRTLRRKKGSDAG